jgi:DNA-binding response OmpR family regulator
MKSTNETKPASILVTDDETNIRMMLRTALESEGYNVREASNGRQALDAMQKSTPDLVVLDLNMPELDGMAVLEQMKQLVGHRPRVVVLTAYGSIPTAVKATRLGASDFIEKPITPADLRQTVRSVLNEPELDNAVVGPELIDSYERVLQQIRKSLRLADFTSAETLLMTAADRRGKHSADYYNLLGVLYEAQRNWRLARKCYGKAIAADKKYEPAQANMRRLYELQTFGRSTQAVFLGDEPGDVIFARLPEARN